MKYFMQFIQSISPVLQNERHASVTERLNKYWTMNYNVRQQMCIDVYMGPVTITNTCDPTFYFNNILHTKNKDH